MNSQFIFPVIVLIIIVQRLTELRIAKKNEIWLKAQGAVEYGKEHYKFIILLHTLFFLSLISEFYLKTGYAELNLLNYVFFVIFFFLLIGRFWVLFSLGRYWNTKILRVPGAALISKGPYKHFKHPNYIIVCCEILVIPLMFNLYYTAFIFTLLNAAMLTVRIKTENKALANK